MLCVVKGAPVPPKSKVDLYAAIRRDARAGMSNRAVQRKYGVGFRSEKGLSWGGRPPLVA